MYIYIVRGPRGVSWRIVSCGMCRWWLITAATLSTRGAIICNCFNAMRLYIVVLILLRYFIPYIYELCVFLSFVNCIIQNICRKHYCDIQPTAAPQGWISVFLCISAINICYGKSGVIVARCAYLGHTHIRCVTPLVRFYFPCDSRTRIYTVFTQFKGANIDITW